MLYAVYYLCKNRRIFNRKQINFGNSQGHYVLLPLIEYSLLIDYYASYMNYYECLIAKNDIGLIPMRKELYWTFDMSNFSLVFEYNSQYLFSDYYSMRFMWFNNNKNHFIYNIRGVINV